MAQYRLGRFFAILFKIATRIYNGNNRITVSSLLVIRVALCGGRPPNREVKGEIQDCGSLRIEGGFN